MDDHKIAILHHCWADATGYAQYKGCSKLSKSSTTLLLC